MAKKKAETVQVRIGADVAESARILGAFEDKLPGEWITDYLRDRLPGMERALMAERAMALDAAEAAEADEEPAPSPAPKRRGRPRKKVAGEDGAG